MTANTNEIVNLHATPEKGAVRLQWNVSSINYLKGIEVIVEKSGDVVERSLLGPTIREIKINLTGEGYTFVVRALVEQGGKSVNANPLPIEETKISPPIEKESAKVKSYPVEIPVPAGGWSVAYADGFGFPISKDHDNTWVPNTVKQANEPLAIGQPPNSNNTAVTSSSQVVVDSNGLHLVCIHKSGVGPKANQNYLSGCCEGTWPSEEPTGYKCFNWNPGMPGITWAFEIVCKWPVNTGEMDPAFWSDGPPWSQEWDFFEGGGWGSQYSPSDGDGGWEKAGVYTGAVGPTRTVQTIWGLGFDPTTEYHRYTVVIHPDGSFIQYIDGKQKASGSTNHPVSGWAPLILRNDTREYSGQIPFSGEHIFSIRSVAVYQDTPHAGQGIKNGGVAPGTEII